jgi:ATP-dependent DNA helicase RecG
MTLMTHVSQGDTQDGTQEEILDKWIENRIRENPQITTEELAKMSNKGIATIKRHIAKMPYIRYVGSGHSRKKMREFFEFFKQQFKS